MRCKDILKLTSVYVAALSLAFTMKGIAQEERETDCRDIVANTETEIREAPAEPEPTEEPGLVIYAVQEEETREPEPAVSLESADEEILLKLAMSEAEGESIEGKALVMLSVLNRVRSDEFPDTVSEVVFQDVQYSPVLDGRYYSTVPDDDCLAALELIKGGWDESMGAMYFENAGADSWHSRNLEFLFREGNHKFYK